MRLVFAGTPEFARTALQALHEAGHEIVLVLTQPDRPGGRGLQLQPPPVKQYALAQGLPVAQPRSLRLDGKYPQDAVAAQQALDAAQADAMVVAAYGLILPQWVLDAMRRHGRALGCLNIHASLLPRWRGAAPIHRAIEAGDAQTGVTIMQMDAGLDTGDMLLWQAEPIHPEDSTARLHDRLAALGARLAVQALADGAACTPQAQDGTLATYAHKVEKHEALIDWNQDAATLVRKVHAFDPFPGASTTLQGQALKVWGARLGAGTPPSGTLCGQILALAREGIEVAAMNSIVILAELQRPGGKRLGAAQFLQGFPLQPGQRLGG
ncbi:MAG: methionyl-tRNA formyltransferase [Rhodoferax sp.]